MPRSSRRVPRLRTSLLIAASCATLAACTAPPASPDAPVVDLADLDGATLSFASPAPGAPVAAGDVVDLVVYTERDDVRAVRFTVDGGDEFVCDANDPDDDCHDEDTFEHAVELDTPGEHTVTASYVGADGREVTVRRTVTVLAEAAAPPDPEAERDSEADGPDEGTPEQTRPESIGTAVDAVVGPRGYLDPNRGYHNRCNGPRRWRVQGQRVRYETGETPTGSVAQVQQCVERFDASIRRYTTGEVRVSRGAIVAALATEGLCEARADSEDASGTLLSLSRCAALMRRDLGGSTRSRRAHCRTRMAGSADFQVELLVRYLNSRGARRLHRNDPVLVAALLDHRAQICDRDGQGHHLGVSSGYLEDFLGAYNAYRTFETRGPRRRGCARRISVVMAAYAGTSGGFPASELNGCWNAEVLDKRRSTPWRFCGFDGRASRDFAGDHGHPGPDWYFDDTNAGNATHSVASERAQISACARLSRGSLGGRQVRGFVYMASGAGTRFQRSGRRTLVDRAFAQLYDGLESPTDAPEFTAWRRQYRGRRRRTTPAIVNALPTVGDERAVRNAILSACRATPENGYLGVYVTGSQGTTETRRRTIVDALNDCTRAAP